MQKIILIVVLTAATFGLKAQTTDESAIRLLLSEQTKAWNNGNINGFMKGYWNSDSLVFIGKNGPTYGYAPTLANYKKNYPETTAMGKLNFDLLQFNKLSPDHYFVIGKWHLQRNIGDLQGTFTLLFKKLNNNWFIIADHSS